MLVLIVSKNVFSQELKVDLSYKYLYANQWDKAVQTYNFSRPFLSEKQPLFQNGIKASFSIIFKNDKDLKHGMQMSYSYFRSSAENVEFNNTLRLHFLDMGYLMHYENTEKWKGIYADIVVSVSSSGLFRYVNDEPLIIDESSSKALGVGVELNLKLGYCVQLRHNQCLSTFISLGYTPYFYSPLMEGVINQTNGLSSKSWTGILSAQMGLSYHLKRSS
jgi:hypothetical protein